MKNIGDIRLINEENLISNELKKLSSLLSDHFTEDIKDINNLIFFFKIISLNFNNFGNNIKLPNYSPDANIKANFFKNNLYYFYESQSLLINKIRQIHALLKNEILVPLILLKDSYQKDNKNILVSLSEIIEEISKHHNILNNIKQNYHYNFQKLKENENNKNLLISNEDKNILENNYYSMYFTEYDNINVILKSSEKKYIKIKEKIIQMENQKNKTLLNIFNSYLKIINNQIKSYENENNQIFNQMNHCQSESDIIFKTFLDNNSTLNKEWSQDINMELFNEKIISQNNNNLNNVFPLVKQKDYEILVNNLNNNNINKNNLLVNNKNNIKIEQFITALNKENSINTGLLNEINEIFQNNKSNYQFYNNFLSLFNETIKKISKETINKSSLFIFKSFSNLVYCTNIINNIIENIKDNLLSNKNQDSYIIFDQIIIIGENAVYDHTFMCSLLNKNKIFKNILIWKNSILNKIILLLNNISKDCITGEKENYLNIKDLKNNIMKIALKVKNNINLNNTKNDIELAGLNKYIENYTNLSTEQKELLNEKYTSEILHEVIKSYLRHMGNYNYILDNTYEINDIILNDLNIDNHVQIEYFIKYYTVCILSNKKEKPQNIYNIKNKKIKEKILLIKNNKDNIIKEKYPCNCDLTKSKCIIIKNISKFLNNKDNLKLIYLNKNYLHLNMHIYKNILRKKNISIKERINIWKAILKCNTYSSIFNYNQLISEINKQEAIKEDKKIMEQIIKDLKRTKYRYNESPASLFKLLRCFAYSNNNINYYQGMNLLTLFLFELTKNEEETFIIINNLFCVTQFGDIIENDFKKLKIFYYIIERLTYIYLPRIYSHFKDNQIKMIYFINPYFLTLFTNIYSYLPDNELGFLLYVWDNFIVKGWKSIFEIILTIFKYLENNILSLKGDEILTFLMNLPKHDIFLDKNLEEFCETQKFFKLNNELINLLEQEISIEMKIKSLGESRILEYENGEEKI